MSLRELAKKKEECLEALQRACEDFAAFSDSSPTCEKQMESVASTVDRVLARLEEFGAFAHSIAEEAATSDAALPILAAQARSLESAFTTIDALADVVRLMTAAVSELEERATAADRFFDAHAFKSFMRQLPGLRTKLVSEPAIPEWKPVRVPSIEPVIQTLKAPK